MVVLLSSKGSSTGGNWDGALALPELSLAGSVGVVVGWAWTVLLKIC